MLACWGWRAEIVPSPLSVAYHHASKIITPSCISTKRKGVLKMLPLFGDERRRREINLGGSTSVTSQAAILDQARTRRMEREAQRKREESAIRIQAWWRGAHEARRVRQRLRRVFQEHVTGVTALRCLILVGQDEELLSLWSQRIHQDDGRSTLHI